MYDRNDIVIFVLNEPRAVARVGSVWVRSVPHGG